MHANKMNPQHFGSDPADSWIRINLEIWIRIPHHISLRFWPWRRFALSQHIIVIITIIRLISVAVLLIIILSLLLLRLFDILLLYYY